MSHSKFACVRRLGLAICLVACGSESEKEEPAICTTAALSEGAVPISIHSDGTSSHFCAIFSDRNVRCWGDDTWNQIGRGGDGTFTTTPAVVPDIACVSGIGVGGDFTCALVEEDGTVRCWGGNGEGSLGDGTFLGRADAAAVPGLRGARAIATGGFAAMVTFTGGGLLGWGLLPSSVSSGSPIALPEFADVVQVAASSSHACVVHGVEGRIGCWGRNLQGELGDGTQTERKDPADVPSLDGVVQADVGTEGTCVVRGDGSVWCWGRGDSGRLGDGGTERQLSPVRVVGIDDAEQVEVGALTACARRRAGRVSCWGHSLIGQAGAAAEKPIALTPVDVPDVDSVIDLALSRAASCALRSDASVVCWGGNKSGELGDGTRISRAEAAPVIW